MKPNKIKSNSAKTVLTISIGFLVIAMIKQWDWAYKTALIVGLIGIFSDTLSKYIEMVWFKLSMILSYIVPNIVLGLLFYLFLFPLSILSKIFRKKDVLKLKNNMSSVYTVRNKEYDQSHFENMW